MAKYTDAIENHLQNVIKKSWTWQKLTQEEKEKFIDMSVFDSIKGTDKMRTEWISTIYTAFLVGLGYTPIGWRASGSEGLAL